MSEKEKLVRTIRESGTDGEKLCEIEASANCYAMNVREKSDDRGVLKWQKFLKDSIAAITFDKGTGFCVMKRQLYHKELDEICGCSPFHEMASTGSTLKRKKIKRKRRK